MTGNTLIDEGTARAQMRREQLTRSRAHGEVRTLGGWFMSAADLYGAHLRAVQLGVARLTPCACCRGTVRAHRAGCVADFWQW